MGILTFFRKFYTPAIEHSNGTWTLNEDAMYFLLKDGNIPTSYVSLPEGSNLITYVIIIFLGSGIPINPYLPLLLGGATQDISIYPYFYYLTHMGPLEDGPLDPSQTVLKGGGTTHMC